MHLRRLTSALVASAAGLAVVDSAALVRRLGRSLASSLFAVVLVALTTATRARIVARLTARLPRYLILAFRRGLEAESSRVTGCRAAAAGRVG